MITVAILINGQPLMARSATNEMIERDGKSRYRVDDGSTLWHAREAGAVPLAIELLKTIKEQKRKPHV